MSDKHPSGYAVSPVVNALRRDHAKPMVEMAGGRAWTGGEILTSISTSR